MKERATFTLSFSSLYPSAMKPTLLQRGKCRGCLQWARERKQHSEKLQRMMTAKETVQKLNEERQALEEDVAKPGLPEDDCGPQVAGQAMSAMNDVLDLGCNDDESAPNLDELVLSLNTDKSRVFELVKSHLEHQLLHENISKSTVDTFKELLSADKAPLCLFSTREACQKFNTDMLSRLNTETKKFPCIDEVDETQGTFKLT